MARVTDEQDEAPTGSRPKRTRRGSTGQAIGGAIVGFDYQVFRATKPPAELVEAAAPVRGVSGEDGSLPDRRLSGRRAGGAPCATRFGTRVWRPASGLR